MNSSFRYSNDSRPHPYTIVDFRSPVPKETFKITGISIGAGEYRYNQTFWVQHWLDNKTESTVNAGTAEFTTKLNYDDPNIAPWVNGQPYVIGDIVGSDSEDYFQLISDISGGDLATSPSLSNKWKKIKVRYACFAPLANEPYWNTSFSHWSRGTHGTKADGTNSAPLIIARISDSETASQPLVIAAMSTLTQAQIDGASNRDPLATYSNNSIIKDSDGMYYKASGTVPPTTHPSPSFPRRSADNTILPSWIPLGKQVPEDGFTGNENDTGDLGTLTSRLQRYEFLNLLEETTSGDNSIWTDQNLVIDGASWATYKYAINAAGETIHIPTSNQTPDLTKVKGETGYYGNDKKGHYANSNRATIAGSSEFDAAFQYPNSSRNLNNT